MLYEVCDIDKPCFSNLVCFEIVNIVEFTNIRTYSHKTKSCEMYCKFRNFREGFFIFAKLRENKNLAKGRNHTVVC